MFLNWIKEKTEEKIRRIKQKRKAKERIYYLPEPKLDPNEEQRAYEEDYAIDVIYDNDPQHGEVECLKCDWRGEEGQLIRFSCPNCGSDHLKVTDRQLLENRIILRQKRRCKEINGLWRDFLQAHDSEEETLTHEENQRMYEEFKKTALYQIAVEKYNSAVN